MAILDFIKNRRQQPEQSQNQKPETAKEMYARESVQDKAALKPIDRLPEQPRAELAEVKARLEIGTQHLNQNAQTPAPSQADSTNNSPEAARQMMSGQEKAAPALSPTSGQLGKTANEQAGSSPSNDVSEKAREQSTERTRQTIARRPPSWER